MHVHVAWQINVWVFLKKPGSRITCQGSRLKCQQFKNVGIVFTVIHLLHVSLLIFSKHDLNIFHMVNCGFKREEHLRYLLYLNLNFM